jgi:DNA-binding CsgD family transcriptional regulator
MISINLSKGELEKLYWKEGLSIRQIAKKFDTSPTKIFSQMKKFKIPRRPAKKPINISKEQLEDLYITQRLSTLKISKILKISSATVSRKLKKFGIPTRKIEPKYKITKEELEELYINKKLSSLKIAKILNMPDRRVRKKLEKFGIPRRTLSEAGTRYQKTPFSGDLKEKAYMLGLRAGDFYAQKIRKLIRFQTSTTHQAQIDLVKEVFGKYSHVSTYGQNGKWGRECFVYCDLHGSFDFLLEKPRRIPDWILSNNEFFYSFLAGYMDCEGSWTILKNDKNNVRFIFSLDSEDKSILEQIKEKLISFGVVVHVYLEAKKGEIVNGQRYNEDYYSLMIYQKSSILNLIEKLLPLSHHREKILKMKFIFRNKNSLWSEIESKLQKLKEEMKKEKIY